MSKIGKISTIKKSYGTSGLQTMQGGLASKGLTRIPGTGVFKYPYKELGGKYRTGLDPDADYIKRIKDDTEREIEIKKVTEMRDRLEKRLGGIDLGPRSSFWNSKLATSAEDTSHVQPTKLMDGDNIFNLNSPLQELTFAWLRAHPSIASSYQAWERGDYPADTQFYVADEEVEDKIAFKKKQAINKAISKLDAMGPDRRKKVARLLGISVTDGTKEEVVYNRVDSALKQMEFKTGAYKGLSTVEVFNRFADMKDNLLTVRDFIKQALQHSVYRMKPNGKIYEGENEIAKNEDELVKFLMDDDNQEDLLMLQEKIKGKKLASL